MKYTFLTVTAHPDDEVLGFGGASKVLSKKGHQIVNCILSGDVEARHLRPEKEELIDNTLKAQEIIGAERTILGSFPNIKFNTVPHLELVQFIEKQIMTVQPDYIFTHHPGDLNDDHVCVSRACQAASRYFQRRSDVKLLKGLYFMEILSSTDWAFPQVGEAFLPDSFIEVGEIGIQSKINALAAYKNVMREFPHPRSVEILKGLASYRGGQAGLHYAEAFQTAFQVLKY